MKSTSSAMKWKVEATAAPKLSQHQWRMVSGLGVILIVMAILQLITFTDFKDTLTQMNLSSPSIWAVLIILAELWGAANFFKLRLSHLFRMVSATLAILVTGFWFVESLQIVTNNTSLKSSGFFGGLLNQQPGWWTVIEATILLFWTLYAVSLTRPAVWSGNR